MEAMAQNLKEQKFPKGTVILQEGKTMDAAVYLVREGKIRIDGNKRNDIITKGTYFGESTFDLDYQYAAERANSDLIPTNREYVMSKPTTTLAPYTVTVLEDAVCKVLTLKACRGIFDTTRLGHGKPGPETSAFDAQMSTREAETELKDLKKHVMLGTGTFGQVWLVSHKDASGSVLAYALKVQSKSELIKAHQAKGVVQEMTIMKELSHPLLLRLVRTYQDAGFVYMLLGLVQGGELFNRIHSPIFDGVPESTAKFYAAGIYEALGYMHRRSIIYRDLKPENVLIDRKGYPVIVDFGFGTF